MPVSTTLTRFQFRRGSTAQWLATTPSSIILAAGEPGVEITSTGTRLKIGDGSTIWANLPYYDNASLLDSTFVTDAELSTTLSTYVLSTTFITYTSSSSAALTTTLTSYVTNGSLSTTLSDYVTETYLETNYSTTGAIAATYAPLASPILTGTTQAVNLLVTGTTQINNLLVTTSATINDGLTVGTEVTARTYTANVSTTSSAIDFATEAFKTLTITAATTSFTATNYGIGRSISTRITNGTTTSLALVFPAGWVFVGTKPTTIAGSKIGILTITSFSTTESQCIAAWAVQT
jgi:hypothetical protein